MKTMLITFAFGAVMGAGLAYTNTADHYEDKARALREATAKAEQERADKAQGEVDELFETWKNAIATPDPVTVTRIVRVKAAASVCPDQSREMDHDPNGVRVELESGTVRSIDAVADKHESLYKQCSAQLRAAQALLKSD